MPLPAIAAVVGRIAASGAAKTVAKTAVKAATVKALTPRQQGSAALSQNQFPESPPWG